MNCKVASKCVVLWLLFMLQEKKGILDKLKVVTTYVVLWFQMFQIEANSEQFLNWCSELPEVSF